MSFFDRKKKDNDDNYSDPNNSSYQTPQQPGQNNFDPSQGQFNNDPNMGMGTQFTPNNQDFNTGNNNYYFGPQEPQPQAQAPVQGQPDNEDWEYTEQSLQNTLDQSADLKSQLRSQLLADRSYCNHLLRTVGSDQIDERRQATDRINDINDSLKEWFGTDEMANEIYLDPNTSYFVFTDDLAANPDSDTTSMWQQMTMTLADRGLLANAISVTYNDQIDATWMNYQNAGFVDGNAYLLNMYNELQGRNLNVPVTPAEIPFDADYRVQHVTDKVDKILDANDKLVMEVSRDSNHQLQIIRHYKDDQVLSRDIFDVNGVISATQFYDHRNANKVVRENFYRQDGTLVLIKSYTGDEPYIQLFSEGNVLMSTFDSDEDLIVWWLKNQALKQNTSTVFVSIGSDFYKKLLSLRDSGIEVIPIVMKQSENADRISSLIDGTDKVSAVIAGTDQVNTYLNKNAKNKMDITTLKEIETPIYKEQK
ncbi:hypothetical protein [Companilactobacillus kimchii]|uniref:Uncharacterized protein n=2 Tax=Companilactobacillus kimchii TaxID=2801452 RepID=A0ABR5NRI2_9LACO|nr:hypothetical protein [Companilactobacillus kimchii]KAE9557870.1 hypothetical protein ATN91_03650 [Companilactobacillus kimchii]KRK50561.1 hypothetical protein FC97_GL001487 [Companilactobacillus kimchii DSM 13961 = JCM 10707]OWF33701.1 hypothetical protein LKACC12383_00841 [Companilactobacillus kimchii]GEO48258.1 hypothetical protein LKI01_22570 [Companilactobacillus paralimentarius]